MRFTQFARTPSSYPVTGMYLAGVAIAVLIAEGSISLGVGVVGLTFLAVLALMVAMFREMQVVAARQVELLARVDQLTAALADANVPIPGAPQPRRDRRAGDRK